MTQNYSIFWIAHIVLAISPDRFLIFQSGFFKNIYVQFSLNYFYNDKITLTFLNKDSKLTSQILNILFFTKYIEN